MQPNEMANKNMSPIFVIAEKTWSRIKCAQTAKLYLHYLSAMTRISTGNLAKNNKRHAMPFAQN